MQTLLFDRRWSITVGDVDISELACEFAVKKTLKKEPNTCSLKIWNLSERTRAHFTAPKATTIRIEAGYKGRLSQIYLGDVRAVAPGVIQGSDIVTELTSGDSEKKLAQSRMAIPLGAKTPPGDALKAIAAAIGVKPGNVSQVAAKLASKGSAVFARGTVITGNGARALTDLCRSAGLEWSIQDGAVQVLDLGQGLETFPYVLSPDSGLIGSPALSNDGTITAETLMIPEIRPGMRVQFDSFAVKGLFRLDECEYSGQTHGSNWSIRITCNKPKGKK